jgi:hypothetical protein
VYKPLSFLLAIALSTISAFANEPIRPRPAAEAAAHAPKQVELSDRGLPVVIYHFDSNQRLAAVRVDGRIVVALDWTSGGEVPVIRFDERWQFRAEHADGDAARQVVLDTAGTVLRSTLLSPGAAATSKRPVLDGVADDLAFASDWRDSAKLGEDGGEISRTRDGRSLRYKIFRHRDGARIARTLEVRTNDQRVLFWDLDLPIDVPAWARHAVPTRLIAGAGGSVQLAVESPVPGGIESAWVRRAASGEPAANLRFLVPTERTRVKSSMLWVCGYSERWYCSSSGSSGYCETYWEPNYCWSNDGGGGGGYEDPDPPAGGGTPYVDPEVKALQDQYRAHNCTVPDASSFIQEPQYTNPGNFGWDEMRDPSSNWAILTDSLRNGIQATRTGYGSALSISRAYQTPDNNAGVSGAAQCSAHVFGTAADVQIRNASGAHDCSMWDAIAAAGNAAGAFVESWEELVRRGTPNHVHLDFGRPANTQAQYGTCNPAELP